MAPAPQIFSYSKIESSKEEIKSYIIDEEKRVHVGDEIIKFGTLEQTIERKLAFRPLIHKSGAFGVRIEPDMLLLATNKSIDSSGNVYWIDGGEVKKVFGSMFPHVVHYQVYRNGLIASKKARLTPKYSEFGNNKTIEFDFFDDNESDKQLFQAEEKVEVVSSKNIFEGVLVYSGIDKNTIKVFYKEFNDDLKKPVFTQELTYDISKEKIIRYKNIKIEIISADSQDLVYKVLSD